MEQVILDSKKYDDFLRCLSILKDDCNDVDIREGIIRQRTNDRYCVFDINLTPILNNISFPISNLKQKLDLLKIFCGQEVSIEIENSNFTFSDQHSKIKFENIDLDYMDNKFMSEEERDNVFTTDESDVILSTNISESLSERMKVITAGFNVNSVQVIIDGDSASIQTKTQAGDQHATIVNDIITDKNINTLSNIVNTPFIIDHDGDIEFKMFLSDDETISSNKFLTTVSDIEIIVYGRSALVNEDEEN